MNNHLKFHHTSTERLHTKWCWLLHKQFLQHFYILQHIYIYFLPTLYIFELTAWMKRYELIVLVCANFKNLGTFVKHHLINGLCYFWISREVLNSTIWLHSMTGLIISLIVFRVFIIHLMTRKIISNYYEQYYVPNKGDRSMLFFNCFSCYSSTWCSSCCTLSWLREDDYCIYLIFFFC